MAHFAELDENNIVKRVVVVTNEQLSVDGIESEIKGIEFCQSLFGGNWIQTSYNGNIRKNYAGQGFIYDSERDAFIAPQPFPSWTLNEQTCQWLPPKPYPDDEKFFTWNEELGEWVDGETL
jgi:hypothetical protein